MNVYYKEPSGQALACIVWMHGLGADANDMMGLAAHPLLSSLPVKHAFMNADIRPVTLHGGGLTRAWYDVYGLRGGVKEDKEGIIASQKQVMQVVEAQMAAGFASNQIILAGFSQGGAMALYTALHSTLPLMGVLALSSYLPRALEARPLLTLETPIFIGYGLLDPVVLPTWTEASIQWLQEHQYKTVVVKTYTMEHTICAQEIKDIIAWIQNRLGWEARS